MVRKFNTVALAGALMMVASPVFAQDMALPLVGNVDLDPFHIFTPAPAPAAAPAPMAKPMMHHHHHTMMHHHHHTMMHKKMMKKPMMKKPT